MMNVRVARYTGNSGCQNASVRYYCGWSGERPRPGRSSNDRCHMRAEAVLAPEAIHCLGTGGMSMTLHKAVCPSYGHVPDLKPKRYSRTLYTMGAKDTSVVILRNPFLDH